GFETGEHRQQLRCEIVLRQVLPVAQVVQSGVVLAKGAKQGEKLDAVARAPAVLRFDVDGANPVSLDQTKEPVEGGVGLDLPPADGAGEPILFGDSHAQLLEHGSHVVLLALIVLGMAALADENNVNAVPVGCGSRHGSLTSPRPCVEREGGVVSRSRLTDPARVATPSPCRPLDYRARAGIEHTD